MSYDPMRGALTWRKRPDSHFFNCSKTKQHQAAIWNRKYFGYEALSGVSNNGYKSGSLSGVKLLAHRVCWAIFYGEWPDGEIDHIDGNRLNNKISNLRCVSRSENAKNLSVKSGELRGVYWYPQTSRWVAKIQSEGIQYHLGYFRNKQDAIKARRDAEDKYGFHKNHGRH